MTSIKRYAHWLQIISIIFAVIIFGQICGRWLFFSKISSFWTDIYAKASYSFDSSWFKEISEMSSFQKLSGFLVDILGLAILCFGIIVFNKLLKLLKSQIFFTSESVKLLNNLSKIALSWALYSPVRGTLLSVITTLHKSAGNRIISVAFGSRDIINIFIFVCMILVTILLQEGMKLKKEQDLTI